MKSILAKNYSASDAENSEEYSVVLGAIKDVLADVNQINLQSGAAQEWLAEHIIWKLWSMNKDKEYVFGYKSLNKHSNTSSWNWSMPEEA